MPNPLNEAFRKKPLEFFKQHAVVPPSDLGQRLVNLSTIYDQATIGHLVQGSDVKSVTHADTDASDIIRWIDFKASTSLGEPGAVTFSGVKAANPERVPIYFLPWRSMHLVSLKIPELSGRDYDRPVDSNPNLFFTAAINGCSVFVTGSPTAPEVHHAGIDGTLVTDAVQFWRDCLAETRRRDGAPPRTPKEVNKANYTKDAAFHGRARTPMAADYLAWLEDQHRDRLTIREVSPWGCVFGIRYGRLWSFYLQENATVTTLEFVKKKDLVDPSATWVKTKTGLPVEKSQQKGLIFSSTVYAARRTSSHPMRVSDFFPGGPRRFESTPLFTKVL